MRHLRRSFGGAREGLVAWDSTATKTAAHKTMPAISYLPRGACSGKSTGASSARFPACVVESFRGSLPRERIARADVGEPFRADVALPKECRMYWDEYEDYMAFGGSPGHNAPASFHKSSLPDYRKTFLLSNVCPQEVVFNAGLWLLLETLCREVVEAFQRVDAQRGGPPGLRNPRRSDYGKREIRAA